MEQPNLFAVIVAAIIPINRGIMVLAGNVREEVDGPDWQNGG